MVYKNGLTKTVGQISVSDQTSACFATDIFTSLSTTTLGTAMGGTPSYDSSKDTLSVSIKCNHTSDEKCTVTEKRDSISISSYETDAIMTAIKTWADAYADSILA